MCLPRALLTLRAEERVAGAVVAKHVVNDAEGIVGRCVFEVSDSTNPLEQRVVGGLVQRPEAVARREHLEATVLDQVEVAEAGVARVGVGLARLQEAEVDARVLQCAVLIHRLIDQRLIGTLGRRIEGVVLHRVVLLGDATRAFFIERRV